jgi:hypothetical protein
MFCVNGSTNTSKVCVIKHQVVNANFGLGVQFKAFITTAVKVCGQLQATATLPTVSIV